MEWRRRNSELDVQKEFGLGHSIPSKSHNYASPHAMISAKIRGLIQMHSMDFWEANGMRFHWVAPVVTMMFVAVAAVTAQNPAGGAQAPPMVLSTTAFPDGGDVPVKYTQAAPGVKPGEGTSLPLTWNNVPAGTQSFVLHMHDMEGARNKTTEDQIHWLVWNIPATAKGMPEGVPAGAQLADGSYQFSATGQM